MKKIILIAIAFIGLQAVAQEHKKQAHKNHDNRQKMMDMSAEEIATLQTKKMTLFLDLNESQQTEIKKINLENATKRKAAMAEYKAKKESGEAQKPTKEQRLAMKNAKLDHMIATKAKMKKILNEEQYAKWEKAQKRGAMKGKQKKKGMKNGHAKRE
ncbi:hypothetical protein VOI54_00075 [Tamlana sp. 2201CG12-4]|uniref:hypothetical protein n=1 Tax=Tamlana sp. 2201CG12-4 TaxID=3112582 RepID=UPI002DBEC459|nr:hypothetical protein [Tamlana sp. 2201CG12-4]MEC3905402.1 hypothetical protein [Tamlana sp. 2201CG12-4]